MSKRQKVEFHWLIKDTECCVYQSLQFFQFMGSDAALQNWMLAKHLT